MEIRDLPFKSRKKFIHKEDLLIVKLMKEHGTNWVKIAESFPGRDAIMIKNRYYSFIKKNRLETEFEGEFEGNKL